MFQVNACWSIVYITDNGNDKIDETLKAGVLLRIVEDLLDSNDKKTVTPAVRAVGNIMTGTDDQVLDGRIDQKYIDAFGSIILALR